MPAGQPVVVFSGSTTHVFAIAAGGSMNHWTSTDGGAWSGPNVLPGGNLAASVPCAIALSDGSVHVFAIGAGGLFSGGSLACWSSTDGSNWTFFADQRASLPGGWNGLAVASPGGQRIEVFATTAGGIVQYSFDGAQVLPSNPLLPNSSGLPLRLLAAVSSMPAQLDVFAVDPQLGMPICWHFDGTWSRQIIGVPGLHRNSGIAAMVTGPGRVELFGITANGRMWSCSGNGTAFVPGTAPAGTWPLPDGVPAVAARGKKLDVLAIGQGGPLGGGPLVHWRFDGSWSEPEVHDGSLAAGGVGAIHGAFGLDAFAFGTNNSLQHWPAGIAGAEHDPWQNWAGNRRTDPVEGHCYPTCLEELVAIVRTATQQDKRARAVGSSWSFGDIAVTPGYVVETNKLNRVIDHVLQTAQVAEPHSVVDAKTWGKGEPSHHFVHVEAGIQIERLMEILDGKSMAPATMGGASGQTLAGVVSTSVHGSHFRLPPFPDWVRAIHLVGPDGMQYWIEPEDKDKRITDKKQLQEALGPDVEIKYDNNWFDTALVTVGSLGIVYSVVLEVRDQYKLRETRTSNVWSVIRAQLADRSLFADGTECVAVAIDPGSVAAADPNCILAIRAVVPLTTPSTAKSYDALGAFCECHNLIELLLNAAIANGKLFDVIRSLLWAIYVVPAVAALTLLLPGVTATLLAILAAALTTAAAAAATATALYDLLKLAGPGAMGDVVGLVLDAHPDLVGALSSAVTMQFQGPTPPPGLVEIAHNAMGPKNRGECATRGLALEIAFDADGSRHLDFIDAALVLLRDEAAMGHMLGGWFSIRFVGKSRAVLSPQRTKMTCMVEFVGLRTLSSTKLLLSGLEALGREHGGIQHWGMFDDLTRSDVERAYPRLSTWRRVRRELTNGGTVRTFDNDFTIRCGLSDPPIRITSINSNPPGSDVEGEYVVIRNDTTAGIELNSWTLRDAANHVFVFPAFVLQPGSDAKVWTKAGANDAQNLFWGRRSAIWNNAGDTAILRDQRGTEVDRYVY